MSAGLFLPSIRPMGRLLHEVFLLAWNWQQHLALSSDALARLLRHDGCSLLLSEALAQRVHDVDDVPGLRLGAVAGDHDAGLLLLEYVDERFLVPVDELCRLEISRLAL